MIPRSIVLVASVAHLTSHVYADVSTYQFPVPRPTPGYNYTGWQAYNPSQPVTEPALPTATQVLDFTVTLDYTGNPTAGIVVPGSFLGISIEMSLAEPIIGPNASWVRPQFLNLMSTLKDRGGSPVLRLGGNSQEKAYLVDSLPGGVASLRESIGPSGFTNTPTLVYTKGIVEAMRQASDLLGITWFMGIPMNQTSPARLEIVEMAEPILGDYLLTWQLGNEPDLYVNHNYRPAGYDETAYMAEFQSIVDQLRNNSNIARPNILGGPGVCECNTNWTNHDLVTSYGYLDKFGDALNALIIMHYPTDNCPNADGSRPPLEQQTAETQNLLALYAQHIGQMTATSFAGQYTEMAAIAASSGKPLILLETNTASCNGFLGLSDAFVAALWNLDLAMALASTGWTHMMMHLGGQAAFYNAFMSPPHNASAPFMWSVGPPMYAALVASEFIGSSGQTRIADLQLNDNNTYMAGYVAYEDNQPVRVLLINYMSDSTGAHDYTARILTNGASSVKVRYLEAATIISKSNITYAGQGWGGYFESDGLLRGEQKTEDAACSAGSCAIQVPAPGAAVVFLNGNTVFDATVNSVQTFATSHTTVMRNTAAVDGLTLATSNGLNAALRKAMAGAGTSSPSKKKNAAKSTMQVNLGVWTVGAFVACTAGFFGSIWVV
ncbi:hypothetical protein BKA62DRAFT_299249 [Auriculariales sp. MPI-PUGE-AT-0066]|nr:hypothetical protein BKA62DRAFT_299249 [Auriculariales sp. MPI-PUGE-AT-0066]